MAVKRCSVFIAAFGLLSDYDSGKFSDILHMFFSDNFPTMDSTEDRFRALIEAGLQEYGGKFLAAETALDLPRDSIRSLFRDNRKAGTSLNRVQELCDAFGLELYLGPPRPRPSAAGFAEAAQEYVRPSLDGSPEALEHGYLPIPFHRADLAHRDLSPLAIARSWIEDQDLDAEHLHAVVMPNDDMWPAFNPGDLLVVDGRFEPEPEPTLCAFTVGGHLKVGWLTVPKGGCLVGFFQRTFTPPVVRAGKSGARIECLGRVAARLDGQPGPWIDAEEKRRLVEMARKLASGKAVT